MDQRALPIDRDATRRAGAELIVEDFEREQPLVAVDEAEHFPAQGMR